ncbi:MAG: Rrf2 family transcriptional regulator [Tissierellia bacterium]|nr:Rrf2 family transcriptional regulator [Tissierellia bacterium]
MKLSTRGRYGLMAMHCLANHYGNGPLSIASIAEKENLSMPYLEQLFARLKQHQLVRSLRGAQGGYVLTRPPEEISIGAIIDALEGELSFTCDGGSQERCERRDDCSTFSILDEIQCKVDEVLASISLADMDGSP